jgi:hypothetical protein
MLSAAQSSLLPCRKIAPLRQQKQREWRNPNDGVLHRRHRSLTESTWRPSGPGLAIEADCIRTPNRASSLPSAFWQGRCGNGSRSAAIRGGGAGADIPFNYFLAAAFLTALRAIIPVRRDTWVGGRPPLGRGWPDLAHVGGKPHNVATTTASSGPRSDLIDGEA